MNIYENIMYVKSQSLRPVSKQLRTVELGCKYFKKIYNILVVFKMCGLH